MKNAWLKVATLLMVLSSLAAAQLGSSSKLTAQVPFDFMAANKIVPAGELAVRVATMDGKILSIDNTEVNVGLFSSVYREESKQAASHYSLVFNRYGDRYFLSEIRLEGSNIFYRLPESKAAAELRANNVSAMQDIVLASLR